MGLVKQSPGKAHGGFPPLGRDIQYGVACPTTPIPHFRQVNSFLPIQATFLASLLAGRHNLTTQSTMRDDSVLSPVSPSRLHSISVQTQVKEIGTK